MRTLYRTHFQFDQDQHSTKDARHCIRIAFTWDSDRQRVLLGYLGQHQETSSS